MKRLSQVNEAYSDLYLDSESRRLIIEKLKNALKEEFNAWYGYVIVRDWLVGANKPNVIKLYDETAKDELEDHGYWLMKRIAELGGTIEDITVTPASWLTAKHTYISPEWKPKYTEATGVEGSDEIVIPIQKSLLDNVANEMGAIESYRELVEIAQQSKDYTTERKCKEILADEEEHLQALQDLLDDYVERRREI